MLQHRVWHWSVWHVVQSPEVPAPIKTPVKLGKASSPSSGSSSPGWQQPSSTQKPTGMSKFRGKMKGLFSGKKKK